MKRSNITVDGSAEGLSITPLGSGQEVGRSCVLLTYQETSILFDCGIHPAYSGQQALPYLDHVGDLSGVSACLLTHFHLDHSGALPYLVGRTNFRGAVLMTPPTKPICKLLWQDYSRVSKISAEEHLYSKGDIDVTLERIRTVNYHETFVLPKCGTKITAYRAGHVLGACMFLVELTSGIRVLYTGDYSTDLDRHLPSAELPPAPVHVLVVESTYGTQQHEPRQERERRFLQAVHEVVRQGGKCLLPVFALGRAQELILLLEEYWRANPLLGKTVPIVYATPLANKSLKIMETYVNMCSEQVIEQANNHVNTFRSMQYVTNVSEPAGVDWETKVMNPNTACVVLCAPGMLQSGTSRELFELWCGDRRNGVVFTAYSVAGTLAQDLQNSAEVVVLPDGRKLAVRCSLKWVSFSAHSDYRQTSEFVQKLNVNHVVLVHGEANLMRRLAAKLKDDFHCGVYTPLNTVEVFLNLRPCATRVPLADADADDHLNNHGLVCALVGDMVPQSAGDKQSQQQPQQQQLQLLQQEEEEAMEDEPNSELEAEDEAERQRVRRLQQRLETANARTRCSEDKMQIDDKDKKKTGGAGASAAAAAEFGYLVVQPHGQKILVTPDELETFTDIRQHKIKFATSVALDAHNFNPEIFDKEVARLFEITKSDATHALVAGCVRVEFAEAAAKVAWEAGPVADLVADTVLRLLKAPASAPRREEAAGEAEIRALVQDVLESAGLVTAEADGSFRLLIEEDNTLIKVSADGRTMEILAEGSQGGDKSDEHAARVRETLRGVLSGKVAVRL